LILKRPKPKRSLSPRVSTEQELRVSSLKRLNRITDPPHYVGADAKKMLFQPNYVQASLAGGLVSRYRSR
jgi:hypothetical protein